MSTKLCLGTAQLGMDYGIGNVCGKPDINQAYRILDIAWENGIRDFDTASLYGDSESILKCWIKSRGIGRSIRVVTKLPSLPDLAEAEQRAFVNRSSKERIAALGIERLEGILLHRSSDMDKPGVSECLLQLVKAGDSRLVGVSVYEPSEAERAIEIGFGVVQITYSIFDRRFEISGFLDHAREKKMEVYARSPFLQGLLLMDPEKLPEHMLFSQPTLRRWRSGLDQKGIHPLTAALVFSMKNTAIDHVVLGVDTPKHLTEVLNHAMEEISDSDLKFLIEQVGEVKEEILLPYLWPQLK